jgi:glycosyltransferase involved in cell wall biosynthesis
MNYTIVIPAKNEAEGLKVILPKLQNLGAEEIIVVDDGSTDETSSVAREHGCTVISHPYSKGNGASVKTGVRAASSRYVFMMDGDGQHDPVYIDDIIKKIENGFDMVVGARCSKSSQANAARGFANRVYNWFASWMVGQKIDDLTSGFRIIERSKFLEFIALLPNGFSYPTTITMSFFRAGYSVGYLPLEMPTRIGKSHLRIWRDGLKFLMIIFKVGTLYSPLKIFMPLAATHFLLGIGYYGYTFITAARFTNMSALLLTTGIVIFLIGLVSEQITSLVYK